MRPRKHLVAYCACVVLVGLCVARLRAQAHDSQESIEAVLLTTVEDRTSKSGDAVFAKVLSESQSADCPVIRAGALLKGRVVAMQLRSNERRDIELDLIFDQLECGRDLKAMELDLVGIQSARSAKIANPFAVHGSVENLRSSATLGSGAEFHAGADGSPAVAPTHKERERGLKVGVVSGISGAHLDIATGPERSSVLSTRSRHLELQRGALLLLLPSSRLEVQTSAANAADPASNSKEAERVQGDVEDSCSPPACNFDESEPLVRTSAEGKIPLRQFGFLPRVLATVSDFDYDTAVAYLSQDELLVSFKARQLLPRSPEIDDPLGCRFIRAVAIDLKTKKVLRVVGWMIPDHKQYLWRTGNGRVIVHVGDELRVYGAALRLEHRIVVGGPLSFLAIAPDGLSLVFGVVRERHSSELHRLVASETRAEPEEDVEVKMLDANFATQHTMMRSSRASAPLLIDAGEILLRRQDENHWAVLIHQWGEQEKTLLHTASECRPEVSILSEDVLFVRGCMDTGGKWYVALRSDGRQILKKTSTAGELPRHASADTAGDAFVIATPRMAPGMVAALYFRPADLEGENLSVYSARDGKLRFSTFIKAPAPSHQEFALSPKGDELAVVQGGHVSLIALPTK
jgi:hypothetical protein